jgi:hypothetical protein
MRLFHYVSGGWVDITTSLNLATDVICGVTTSLSPFALFEPSETVASALTLTLPADVTAEATSAAGASVSFTATALHEIDGPLLVACTPASGHVFALGATTVECSAGNTAGDTAHGSFVVNVVDTTPPALTVPAGVTAAATSPAGAAVSFVTSALDLVDGAVAVTCTPSSGAVFPIGMTTVRCSAGDAHANRAASSFKVTVKVGAPRLSVRVLSATPRTTAGDMTLTLEIRNLGDGIALQTVLDRLALKTLAGSGTPTVVTAVPIDLGTIAVGDTRVVAITLNVPATVMRFSLTEGGRYMKVNGGAYRFSMSQAVRP